MKITPKSIFKIVIKVVLSLILIVALYVLAAYTLPYIPVNTSFKQAEKGVDIFIRSNGVHTDFVVPVENEFINWREKIKPEDFKPMEAGLKYIAFGWGDKGFYLYTPTWSELKFSTAFRAAFWLSSSAMHVTYYDYIPKVDERTKKIRISPGQYQELIGYIDKSFQKDSTGNYRLIGCCHYNGQNDNFYEGEGIYNLFKTCNSWTNTGLKKTSVKAALWSPLAWGVMYHLD